MSRISNVRLWDKDGKFLSWLSVRQANQLKIRNLVYEIFWNDTRLGVQYCKRKPSLRTSPTSLTAQDTEINSRITKHYLNEDLIRVIQAKLMAWPAIHDTHAPIISAGKAHGVKFVTITRL